MTNLVEVVADPVGRVSFRGLGAGGPRPRAPSWGIRRWRAAKVRPGTRSRRRRPPRWRWPTTWRSTTRGCSWHRRGHRRRSGSFAQHVLARDDDAVVVVRPMSSAAFAAVSRPWASRPSCTPVLAEA
ncbi:MAG: hypothetical protein R3C32_06415 [Chloroflexota bacterium]